MIRNINPIYATHNSLLLVVVSPPVHAWSTASLLRVFHKERIDRNLIM